MTDYDEDDCGVTGCPAHAGVSPGDHQHDPEAVAAARADSIRAAYAAVVACTIPDCGMGGLPPHYHPAIVVPRAKVTS